MDHKCTVSVFRSAAHRTVVDISLAWNLERSFQTVVRRAAGDGAARPTSGLTTRNIALTTGNFVPFERRFDDPQSADFCSG